MLHYKQIDIFTAEEARWQGEPLANAVIQFIRDLKIAARCLVLKGVAGCYESGELATARLEVLSYNMPVWIKIILPAAAAEVVMAEIQKMVTGGVVAVADLQVVAHKTTGLLMPRHTRVRDIMTSSPQAVAIDATMDAVARLLLSSTFTGLPVVDAENRPVGVISQSDLIYRAGLPIRPGLLAESDQEQVDAVLEALAATRAREVMSTPPVVIQQDKLATEAVCLMLDKQVTRLPVVDDKARLVGILSRLDIFHTILRECPDWQAFQKQAITVVHLGSVADIMRQDVPTVLPETPVADLIATIDNSAMQRLFVVDREGHFLGLISDRDLLVHFADRHPGIWDYLASKLPFTELGRRHKELHQDLQLKTAGEIMQTGTVTVREDAPISAAIRLILDGNLKRLPVVDEQGKFRGLVSREALLRGGFAAAGASA